MRRPPMSAARRSPHTGSTTRCSTPPRRARSPCTTCRRTPARRSLRRCCTGHASESGTRRRTADMRRRRCSSCSSRRHERMKDDTPTIADASPRPKRGDELELRVESLAFGGEGVARLGDSGYVVFVAGAIPGDIVRAVVHKRKRSYAHARTVEVLEPSPERIAPVANHPGVPWQVLPYRRQLEIKQAQVDEALRRI